MGLVEYKEVRDWSERFVVRKAVVIAPEDCTRERLIALANQLSLRFAINPVVVVNIFNDERAAATYDQQLRDDEEKEFALAHWPARYVKSWPVGLNEFVIYPNCDHHSPETLAF